MKKTVEIKGITTTSVYNDGDCMSVVNMRKKNGVFKPVSPRKAIYTLANKYDELFVHQLPSTGENWIGVRSGKLWYIQNIGTPGQTDTELCTVASVPSITQIGNILNVLDTTGLKYILWYDNEYKLIDSNFDGDQTSTVIGPVRVDLKVDGELDASGYVKTRAYRSDVQFSYGSNDTANTDENRKARAFIYDGLHAKALAGIKKEGFLNGFIMAITALELYDGTFIMHSNPVLLNQSFDMGTRYKVTVSGTEYNYLDKKAVILPANAKFMSYENNYLNETVINNDGYAEMPIILDESYAFVPELTDMIGTKMKYIPNILGFYKKAESNNEVPSQYLWLLASYNRLKFKVNATIDQKYKSLIKSMSVFITPEITLYKTPDAKNYAYVGKARTFNSGDFHGVAENYLPPLKTDTELYKELADNQRFYKIKEIPFDELVAGDWIDLTDDLKGKLGDNLVNQDELPVDNMTHHTLLPQKQMVYNSRLHAIDYKTIFSRGWGLDYFLQNQGVGQFIPSFNTSPGQGWIIKTDIKTETGLSTVVRYQLTEPNVAGYNQNEMGPLLSYPDSRAVKMTITRMTYFGGNWYAYTKEFKLTASETQNFAYYISTDLKPFGFTMQQVGQRPTVPAETQREQIFRNGLKVSSLNNPFNFPALNTYMIGTSVARNAASNAMRASDGQFGQYPVYVFTSENIYALNVGDGSTVYSNITPISNETPISDIICQTPFGVVFVGKRGIFVINGQEVTMLSAQLEENPVEISISNPAGSFIEFLQTLKNILYNVQKNELILVNDSDYNYVLNIDTQSWYLSTEKTDYSVKNIYPELFVLDDKTIKDYSQSGISSTNVSLLTRPIYFGIDEVKKLLRCIVRGRIYNMNTADTQFLSLYGSNDAVNFTQLRGFTIPEQNQGKDYKDFDMGLMTRATYRNYLIAFTADVDEKSEIDFMDFMVEDHYNNDKLR